VTGDGQVRLQSEGEVTANIDDLTPFSSLAGYRLQGSAELLANAQVDFLAGWFDLTTSARAHDLRIDDPTLGPLLNGALTAELSVARQADGMVLVREATLAAPGATVEAEGSLGVDQGLIEIRASVANLGALIPDVAGPASLAGSLRRTGSNWQIDASAKGPGGIAMSAAGTVAHENAHMDMALNGSAPLALVNRRLSGQAASGLVQFDLAVNGPAEIGSVTGVVSVDNGRFSAPTQNFRLEQIIARVNLSGGRAQLSLAGNVATDGRIRVEGPISLSAPYNAGIIGRFDNVRLRDSTLYEARLSGLVNLDGPLAGTARVTGAIDVTEAELRLPQFGPSYSALEGLKHLHPAREVRRTLRFAGLDSAAQPSSSGPGYLLDLTVNAPNRLFVRGRGLDAELGGTLMLQGTTSNVVPVGELNLVRGRLDLLRRRLELTEGSLWMRGSFDPVIAFRATTRIEDVDVSLRLDGVASAPDLTVTSVPEMPQEEALSFFLFGRSVTQISALQAVQLASAIRTLSGRGGNRVTDRIRRAIGVDDLDIGTDSEGTTQARAGRYISDNIYTDLTVKSDGTSQININLEARPNLVVRGRMGSDGNTGIGAYFEKDY
jgi:translocation and assembly module TamB